MSLSWPGQAYGPNKLHYGNLDNQKALGQLT